MDAVVLVLVVVLLGLVGLLLWQLVVLRRRATALATTVASLTPTAPLPFDLEVAFGAGTRRVIVVEILNPIELATSRVKAAGVLGGLAPRALRKIVYDETVKMMILKLAEEGVKAEVRIHAAA